MLNRNLMVGTDDRPLEKGPNPLDAVSVNVATDILFSRVIDRLVTGVIVANAPVRTPVVGMDGFSIVMDGFTSKGMESLTAPVWNHLEDNLAFPLDGPNDDGLIAFVPMTFAPNFATNKGLVNLYDALEFDGGSIGNCGPDAVAEIPSGFVGDIQRPLQLAGGNAFLSFNHQVSGHEPFVEG